MVPTILGKSWQIVHPCLSSVLVKVMSVQYSRGPLTNDRFALETGIMWSGFLIDSTINSTTGLASVNPTRRSQVRMFIEEQKRFLTIRNIGSEGTKDDEKWTKVRNGTSTKKEKGK